MSEPGGSRKRFWMGVAISAAMLLAVAWETVPLLPAPVWMSWIKCVLIALLLLSGAWGMGDAFTRNSSLRHLDEAFRTCWSVALGLLSFVLAVFVLGEAGLLRRWSLLFLFLIGAGGGTLLVVRRVSEFSKKRIASSFSLPHSIVPILGVFLVVPIAVFVLAPPFSYDVLEYHLGGPVAWLDAGSSVPHPGNFYTGLPSAMELLYTLAIAVNPTEPFLQAKLFYAIFSVGFLWASYRFATGTSGSTIAGWTTVILLLAYRPFFLSATDANNDLAAAFFFLMSVLTLLQIGASFWAGIVFGAAAGFKFSILSVGTAAILPFLVLRLRDHRNDRFGAMFLFVLGALVAFAPWLLRAWRHYGLPFFPLAGLGTPSDPLTWSSVQANAYAAHHFAAMPWQAEYWARWPERLFQVGAIPVMLAVVALVGSAFLETGERRRIFVSVISFAFGLAAWNLLGSSPSRFLLPVVPMAIGAGLGTLAVCWPKSEERPPASVTRPELRPVSILLAGLALMVTLGAAPSYLLSVDQSGAVAAALGQHEDPGASPYSFQEGFLQGWHEAGVLSYFEELALRAALRPDEPPVRVFCLYEARTAALPVDAATVTVHDALPPEWGSVEKLREAGFTHLLVNELELERLREFYPTTPHRQALNLPDDPAGVMPGSEAFYLDWTPWMLSVQVAREYGVTIPWGREGPELLRRLPELRKMAVSQSGDLTARGHRIFMADIRARNSRSGSSDRQ